MNEYPWKESRIAGDRASLLSDRFSLNDPIRKEQLLNTKSLGRLHVAKVDRERTKGDPGSDVCAQNWTKSKNGISVVRHVTFGRCDS